MIEIKEKQNDDELFLSVIGHGESVTCAAVSILFQGLAFNYGGRAMYAGVSGNGIIRIATPTDDERKIWNAFTGVLQALAKQEDEITYQKFPKKGR